MRLELDAVATSLLRLAELQGDLLLWPAGFWASSRRMEATLPSCRMKKKKKEALAWVMFSKGCRRLQHCALPSNNHCCSKTISQWNLNSCSTGWKQ
jgi:hypothetical protein